jgi:hypothetical protein
LKFGLAAGAAFAARKCRTIRRTLARSSSRLLLAEPRFGGVTLNASRNASPILWKRRASSRQPISSVRFRPIADIGRLLNDPLVARAKSNESITTSPSRLKLSVMAILVVLAPYVFVWLIQKPEYPKAYRQRLTAWAIFWCFCTAVVLVGNLITGDQPRNRSSTSAFHPFRTLA